MSERDDGIASERRRVSRRRVVAAAAAAALVAASAGSAVRREQPATPQVAENPLTIGPAPGIGATIGSFDLEGTNGAALHEDLRRLSELGGSWARTNLSAGHLVADWNAPDGSVALHPAAVERTHALLDDAAERGIAVCMMYINHYESVEASHAEWVERTTAWWRVASAEFAPKIAMAQIFNEAGGHHYRFYRDVPAVREEAYRAEMADLILRARSVIQEVNPQVQITTNLYGWPVGPAIEEQWNRELQALAPAQDLLTVDAYVDWDDEGAETLNGLIPRIARLEETFGKKIAIGEIGVPGLGLAPSVHADRLERIVTIVKDALPTAYATFLYQLRDSTTGPPFEQTFGLLEADGTPKEAFLRLERIGLA